MLIAEFITAALMFISSINYLLCKRNSHGVRMFSLGMLFYALLIGIGEFTDRKIYVLTVLFSIVAIATAVMYCMNVKEAADSKQPIA